MVRRDRHSRKNYLREAIIRMLNEQLTVRLNEDIGYNYICKIDRFEVNS